MNENSSRVEALLQNILGSEFNLEAPRSRMEQILKDIIDEVDPISITPKSRIENLLIELADSMSHSTARLYSLAVIENGIYTPDPGYDGFNQVDVEVPQSGSSLEPLTVVQNGRYFPSEGYDGFNYVDVDIDVSSNLHSLSVSENGIYTPDPGYDGFDTVEVNVPQTESHLHSLTVTENGIYEPEEGYDGFDSVEVVVPREGYTNYMTVTGSLTDVLSNIDMPFADIVSYLHIMFNRIHVFPWAIIDASQIGLGTGGGPIVKATENGQTVLEFLGGKVDQSSSLATTITWDSTGLINAYVEQNGTITSLLSVASQINITIYLPWGD